MTQMTQTMQTEAHGVVWCLQHPGDHGPRLGSVVRMVVMPVLPLPQATLVWRSRRLSPPQVATMARALDLKRLLPLPVTNLQAMMLVLPRPSANTTLATW